MRRRLLHVITEHDGHSLVEVIVATALLATVLVSASGTALYLLKAKHNEPYRVALVLGQQAMEDALFTRSHVSETMEYDEGRWRVERMVVQEDNRVVLRVRVFRRGRPRPLVELMTVRLLA